MTWPTVDICVEGMMAGWMLGLLTSAIIAGVSFLWAERNK